MAEVDDAKPQVAPKVINKKIQSIGCEICNIVYSGTEVEILSHENGKKHKEKLRIQETASKQVYINAVIEDSLRTTFKLALVDWFGEVERVYFNDRGRPTVTVTFKNIESVGKAISSRYIFYGRKLHFEKRNFILRKAPKREKKLRAPPPSRFVLKGTFDEQLQGLISKVERTDAKCQELQSLYSDLEMALIAEYPDCKVVPFGSVITGLAFNDSDVDCFVSIHPIQMKMLQLNCEDVDLLHSRFVRNTKNILYKYKTSFTHIVSIPRASVPIVKFLHVKSKINCDVSFKNGFGIYNSQLISYFIASDPRLKPLLMFIKYWAKNHNFLGYITFSSYALTMLIIHYLQQISPPILVPIKQLQETEDFDCFIDGWNCGFDHISTLPKTQNTSSVLTLLQGFYHFYEEYDFVNNVICPFEGKAFPIDVFNKLENLSPSYKTYIDRVNAGSVKHLTYTQRKVYVQDPFEHSRNIANAPDIKLKHFQGHCKLAHTNINNAISNNKFDNLISMLLSQRVAPPKSSGPQLVVKFPATKTSDIDKSSLVSNIKIVIENILTEMVKCKYEMDNDEERTEEKVDFHHISFKCEALYNIWYSRKLHAENVTVFNDILLKEIEITNSLVTNAYKNIEPKISLFSFYLNVNIYENSVKFMIRLSKGDRREYKGFATFLISRLTKIFNAYFSKLMT